MFIRFLSRVKGTLEKCVREKYSSVWAFQTVSVARKAFFLSHIYRIQLDTVSSLTFFDRRTEVGRISTQLLKGILVNFETNLLVNLFRFYLGSCWLSLERRFIWSFVGPVLLVLLVSGYYVRLQCSNVKFIMKFCVGYKYIFFIRKVGPLLRFNVDFHWVKNTTFP